MRRGADQLFRLAREALSPPKNRCGWKRWFPSADPGYRRLDVCHGAAVFAVALRSLPGPSVPEAAGGVDLTSPGNADSDYGSGMSIDGTQRVSLSPPWTGL